MYKTKKELEYIKSRIGNYPEGTYLSQLPPELRLELNRMELSCDYQIKTKIKVFYCIASDTNIYFNFCYQIYARDYSLAEIRRFIQDMLDRRNSNLVIDEYNTFEYKASTDTFHIMKCSVQNQVESDKQADYPACKSIIDSLIEIYQKLLPSNLEYIPFDINRSLQDIRICQHISGREYEYPIVTTESCIKLKDEDDFLEFYVSDDVKKYLGDFIENIILRRNSWFSSRGDVLFYESYRDVVYVNSHDSSFKVCRELLLTLIDIYDKL
jgi:hypothetical protein